VHNNRDDNPQPSSFDLDGQPGNPSGPHHPSDDRRRNREAAPIEVTHHGSEPHEPRSRTGRRSASGAVKESRNEVCPRHPMAANRSFRVIRRATIAFSPNIVQTVAGGPFRTASVNPCPGRKNANRPRARRSRQISRPRGWVRQVGRCNQSGAVRKSRPSPISAAPNLAR